MSPPSHSGDEDNAVHPATGYPFSFENFLSSSLAAELMDATVDTGPVDNAAMEDEGAEEDEGLREHAYDHFFGTSPLSTAPATPASSRPPSPAPADPRKPNKRARLASPHPPTQHPPPTSNILNAVSSKLDSTSKSRRDKKKSKAARQKKRRANPENTHPTPAAHILKTKIGSSQEHSTNYDAGDIPSAKTGYIAMPDEKGRVYKLNELLLMGFELVKWDGRSSKPILDKNGLVVAVLVGAPNDAGWDEVCESAYNLLHAKAPSFKFTKKSADHRRGKFPAVNVGISFGGGQMASNLCHTKAQTKALDDILASTCFIRMAGFASKALSSWMPQVHAYYRRDFDKLLHHHPRLQRNFASSVWASAALNFGPKTITTHHRDFANLPFGICAVTALGKYDPTKGGHVVLWELGLVIEFPPGATVLIPSAAISHSNTPISAHECRASFTQYSAGGLFRWVQHGFQTEAKFTKGMSDEKKAEVAAENEARSKLGLSLFPKLSDLRNPQRKPSTLDTLVA